MKEEHDEHRFLKILGVIVLSMILISVLFYLDVKADDERTIDALLLLRSEQLEVGLEGCNTLKYEQYKNVCYITYIGMKINSRLPWDKGLCDEISIKRQQEKNMIGCS